MALSSSKLFYITLLFLAMLNMATIIVARSLPGTGPGPSLAVRLHSNGSSTECWDSLMELKSCTSEVILFFLNGETYLGPNCCRAVRIIEHHCWPTMLSAIGFTPEESDILRGYCDGDTAGHLPPSPPSVGIPVIIGSKGMGPGPSLAVRLQSNGSSTECWDSLVELKSCTSEVVLFFLNGETYLGPNCCRAIQIIEHHCWPNMLSAIGVTPEEGNILRGYCDVYSLDVEHLPLTSPSVGTPVIIGKGDHSSQGNGPEPSLAARLQSNGSSTECWDSLIELKACTGEVILFFLNGETRLGPNCCQAIRVIEHHCWPTMLSALGFTPEEGDILRGYCDGNTAAGGHLPPTPPSPVGLTMNP